jgi:hypothetical protein
LVDLVSELQMWMMSKAMERVNAFAARMEKSKPARMIRRGKWSIELVG